MKLTNDQICELSNAGFGRVNYSSLPAEEALNVYRLRRQVASAFRDIAEMGAEIMRDVAGGCAPEDLGEKSRPLLVALGQETRDIQAQPIAFASWLQLLKDNPSLAGCEDILAEFIAE